MGDGLVLFEEVEGGDGCGAGGGVGGVGVAAEEAVFDVGDVSEALEDGIGGEDGGEGDGAGGDGFAEDEEIGGGIGLFEGEEGAGAPEAGEYFVEDEQGLVLVAPSAEGVGHFGGVRDHACGSGDEGFDDDGGDAFWVW